MGHFAFIEHTADKGFRVEGADLRDLFETSVQGLAKLLRKDLPLDSEELPRSHQLVVIIQRMIAVYCYKRAIRAK